MKGIFCFIHLMVDHTGFEPVTPCMSSKCSNRAELMIHRISSPLEGPVVDRGRATEGSPASGTSRIFHLIFHFDPKSHMVPETGIEPVTLSLEGSCSIQLSYSGREVYICMSLYLYNSLYLFKDGWYYMENWRKARGILTEKKNYVTIKHEQFILH